MKIKIMRNENDLYKKFLRTVEQKISLEKTENCYENRNAFCSSKKLSDENEFNKRFAEEVSKYFGLKYYQQSCIAGEESELEKLKRAKEIVSMQIETDKIEKSPHVDNLYFFIFWS